MVDELVIVPQEESSFSDLRINDETVAQQHAYPVNILEFQTPNRDLEVLRGEALTNLKKK